MESSFDALGTYCVPLEVGVETGILGLCAFGALIVSLLARGHAAFWALDGKSDQSLAAMNRWGQVVAIPSRRGSEGCPDEGEVIVGAARLRVAYPHIGPKVVVCATG